MNFFFVIFFVLGTKCNVKVLEDLLINIPYFNNLLKGGFSDSTKGRAKLSIPCSPKVIKDYFKTWLPLRKNHPKSNLINPPHYTHLMVARDTLLI